MNFLPARRHAIPSRNRQPAHAKLTLTGVSPNSIVFAYRPGTPGIFTRPAEMRERPATSSPSRAPIISPFWNNCGGQMGRSQSWRSRL